MSRPSPSTARPAHPRTKPGPSPMCLHFVQLRPGLGPQYVGPGPARPAGCGPGRLGLKSRPVQGTSVYVMAHQPRVPLQWELPRHLASRTFAAVSCRSGMSRFSAHTGLTHLLRVSRGTNVCCPAVVVCSRGVSVSRVLFVYAASDFT